MHFKSITIKDIAKALGLSISTVSKALRNSYEISEETKKMVGDYAHSHNYRPNPLAQGLRKGTSKTIGVVVAVFDDNFFSKVIDGIESSSNEHGYSVIFTQSRESYDKEKQNVQTLADRSLDGLLISLSSGTKDLSYLKELSNIGLPIVLFDRISEEINTHKVVCNNYKGGYEATEHLIKNGCKNIAHITSNITLSYSKEREDGYLNALKYYSFPIEESNIIYCNQEDDIYDQANNAIDKLLNKKNPPDAIFCGSDVLSTTVFRILKKKNIRIPEEIAIVGFSNSASAEAYDPSFTTVEQPTFEMGQKATELLIQLMEAKRKPLKYDTIVLDPVLHVRKSSQKLEIV
ncbi:LacI family transcriptional regulator [Rhizosphaericola mali]|uniref:LacI family transcriptional regulator n=2 Tax=Rhizosphaericola mali TaxID=2545455 RepID=A0A5P2GAE3_9BACT|nr:LacI family transcriptional regulator [Rhizosphaericola mali]